jgi:hypothetical protein
LLHACFGERDALEFGATHVQLKEGRTLGELSPAPMFAEAWKEAEAASGLLSLAVQAHSRLVRLWAVQLFQREHASFAVSLETILALLEHDEADVQQSKPPTTIFVCASLIFFRRKPRCPARMRVSSRTSGALCCLGCIEGGGKRPKPSNRLPTPS